MKKIALITGGSSGIGLNTAICLSKKGYTVYELSRSENKTLGIIHIRGDVTNEESIRSAISHIISKEGKIDLLINSAGFGISGAAELTDTAAAQKQLDVNFFGMSRMCRAVLPFMRAEGRGRIINLSSVAATVPIPFQAFYSASKAAINAYTMALANEVKPYGVSVCAVMPGDIKTGFTSAREKQPGDGSVYSERLHRSVIKMEKDEKNGMSPETAARFISHVAEKHSVKPLYAVRADYKLFVMLSRLLPVRLVNRIIYSLYAK